MTEIKVRANQTLFDIALEQYGTCEAVSEILSLNDELTNAPSARMAAGVDGDDTSFYAEIALEEGISVKVDETSSLRKTAILRDLQGVEINSYNNE